MPLNNPPTPASIGAVPISRQLLAGANVTIDAGASANLDADVTIAATVDGTVTSVNSGTNVVVDNTDPANPVVNVPAIGVVDSVVAGANITVDNTDPNNPIVSSSGTSAVINGARIIRGTASGAGITGDNPALDGASAVVDFDVGGFWDATNNRFVIPTGFNYIELDGVVSLNGPENAGIRIVLNTAQIILNNIDATNFLNFSTGLIPVTAGDIIEVVVNCATAYQILAASNWTFVTLRAYQ